MTRSGDPGWRPAAAVAVRILGLRRPSGSLLTVLRAVVLFLSGAAVVTAVAGMLLTRGDGDARIAVGTARIVLIGAVLAATSVLVVTRAERPDLRSAGGLAVWFFTATMRRVLAGAAVGPIGFLLSWLAHSGVHAVVASVAAVSLIAAAAPTGGSIERLQATVSEAGSDLVALEVLSVPYR